MAKAKLAPVPVGEPTINFMNILKGYLRYWWVFLISLAVCLGLAAYYLYMKAPVYEIYSSIILNDDDDDTKGSLGSPLGNLMSSFSMGSLGSKSAEDEVFRISSHTNVEEVVRRLGLNKITRRKESIFSPSVWYYGDSPITVDAPAQVLDTISKATKFKIYIPADGKNIKVKVKQGKKTVLKETFPSFPFVVHTPMAIFNVDKTKYYKPGEAMTLECVVKSPSLSAIDISKKFNAQQMTKKSSIIILDRQDFIIPRAKDFLTEVINVYNEKSVNDRQNFASGTVNFIDERLLELYSALEKSEAEIESYKRSNNIVDANAEAEYIFKKKASVESELVQLQTREGIIKMVIDFLKSDSNKYSLIPFTADIPEEPITAYNTLVLERMKLENSAKGNNTGLKAISDQIDAMRANLLISLDRDLAATRIAINDLNRIDASSKNRMSDVPTMERELYKMYRDQKIQNQIYGFLLQKREENELKRSRTNPPGKIVDFAYNLDKPKSPKKPLVIIGAGVLGLAFGVVGANYLNARNRLRKEGEDDMEENPVEETTEA